MTCPNCKEQISNNAKFCPKCGCEIVQYQNDMDDGFGYDGEKKYGQQQYDNQQYENQTYGGQSYGDSYNNQPYGGGQPNREYPPYDGMNYGAPKPKKPENNNNAAIIIGIISASVIIFVIVMLIVFFNYEGSDALKGDDTNGVVTETSKPTPTPTPTPTPRPTPTPSPTPTPRPTPTPTPMPMTSNSVVTNPRYNTFSKNGISCPYPAHFIVYDDGSKILYTVRSLDGTAREIINVESAGSATVASEMAKYKNTHSGRIEVENSGSDYYVLNIDNGRDIYYKYCKFYKGNMYWFEFICPSNQDAQYRYYIEYIYNQFRITA